mmetsp:Transcript_23950/g.24237  ORF Transcript_23950/g.24237 Transcript_23950/m.24237 type:complete len:91 (+) Transcript_23950:140-412(+)
MVGFHPGTINSAGRGRRRNNNNRNNNKTHNRPVTTQRHQKQDRSRTRTRTRVKAITQIEKNGSRKGFDKLPWGNNQEICQPHDMHTYTLL